MNAKAQPVLERINQFTQDFNVLFKEAVESTRQEIRGQEHREAMERLYGPRGILSSYQTLKVNRENARFVSKIFKLMESLDDVKADSTETIHSRGKEHGFTVEESMCIYNMNLYAKALSNLGAQKDKMVEIILAEE
ncbi:hypothetical protein [Methanolobus sp.]|uniref:hypothetical protein n=1 Tax=Methanolobus sp. TaxID=1874737 RepID=UPI0025E5E0A6|nr:hypothetical protein [Methanolobus sp.]